MQNSASIIENYWMQTITFLPFGPTGQHLLGSWMASTHGVIRQSVIAHAGFPSGEQKQCSQGVGWKLSPML